MGGVAKDSCGGAVVSELFRAGIDEVYEGVQAEAEDGEIGWFALTFANFTCPNHNVDVV